MTINTDIIKAILIQEGYPEFMIDDTIDQIKRFQPPVMDAFQQWLLTGEDPAMELEGFTFSMLKDSFGMTPIGAFLTLNWLAEDPKEAVEGLNEGIL